METDQAIAASLPGILRSVTVETGSEARAMIGSTPARLSDQELAELEEVANSPLAVPTPCDQTDFAKLMRMLSILPSRADDELTGKLRLNVYHRMMGEHPREAIAFMVETALTEFDWFPTPKQCLEILGRWVAKGAAEHKFRRVTAVAAIRRERQARLEDTMAALERREFDQEHIDALPERTRAIGAECGFLRLHDDGVYRARPVPVTTHG